MRLVAHDHEPDVARHVVPVPRGAIEPAVPKRQFRMEDADTPRLGKDHGLDRQDVAEVLSLELLDAQVHGDGLSPK